MAMAIWKQTNGNYLRHVSVLSSHVCVIHKSTTVWIVVKLLLCFTFPRFHCIVTNLCRLSLVKFLIDSFSLFCSCDCYYDRLLIILKWWNENRTMKVTVDIINKLQEIE